ncbi:MAG: SEC59/DGK1/VTE5 family protein [Candidatus Marinimicrobia bacterium]|nr:SEC59/DGK1/VTE5 family protein [Candidatus Neomarinimicrobiota bacterium]
MTISSLRSNELVRKAIHLSSSAIPLLYWFGFERNIMLKGVIFLATGFLTAEYLRFHSQVGKQLFMKVFGSALRQHEHQKLTGATYVFTGSVLAIFLFPKEIAVPALLILSISDTFAALVGIPYGKHPFLAKSREGSITFFLTTLLILELFRPEDFLVNMVIALILTITEALPLKLDDNFVIPIAAGLLLSLTSLF